MSTEFLSDEDVRKLYMASDAAHDFDHILRVARMAALIARAEAADLTVVRLAALLHDVPAPASVYANGKLERGAHHLAAAKIAGEVLVERGLGTGQVENVVHCIEAHRFRDQSIQPLTIEAKCLYDADKLDSIGAVGIGRVFAFAGASGSRLWTQGWTDVAGTHRQPVGRDFTPVHEYVYKLRHLLATLHTETARRIGHQRTEFLKHFFDQLDLEMQGLA